MTRKKNITTQDIATRAGVSKATVSYVLNATGSVSEEMRAKVLAIAKELGYRENRLAKATRTGKTHTIGLVVPDLCNPFFPEMAQGVVDAASGQGYSVFLVDARTSREEEAKGVRRLLEYAIEGLIWCPLDDSSVAQHNLSCPVVMTERPTPGFDNVYADSYEGGRQQGQMVVAHGHKRIGILSGPERSPVALLRKQGLYQALGDEVDIAWDFPLEYGTAIPESRLQQIIDSGITCVVAANDTLAIGLMRVLHERGIRVPQQISVIGFDHIDWADLVFPPLTTVALPIRQLGSTAVEVLLARIGQPDGESVDVKLPVSILERGTMQPPEIDSRP